MYRTVRLLEERGILERRDFGGGRARYEPTEHGRHYHLIDIDTGRVIEFEGGDHERLMEQIAARLGFELVSTRLEIYGRRAEGAHGVAAGSAAGGQAMAGASAIAAARGDRAPVIASEPSPAGDAGPNGAAG